MLFHGRHSVSPPSIGLLSLNWLFSPIILSRRHTLPLRTLLPCIPLHLMLPLCSHLVTGLLEYTLIVLYLPLYISLELTHPVLCVHLRHYTRLWLSRVIAFSEWISGCQLLCRLWPQVMLVLTSLWRGVLFWHIVVFHLQIIAWWTRWGKCTICG